MSQKPEVLLGHLTSKDCTEGSSILEVIEKGVLPGPSIGFPLCSGDNLPDDLPALTREASSKRDAEICSWLLLMAAGEEKCAKDFDAVALDAGDADHTREGDVIRGGARALRKAAERIREGI